MLKNDGNAQHPVKLEDIPQIRRIWHKETWYCSVIDELEALPLRSADGRLREMDTAHSENRHPFSLTV